MIGSSLTAEIYNQWSLILWFSSSANSIRIRGINPEHGNPRTSDHLWQPKFTARTLNHSAHPLQNYQDDCSRSPPRNPALILRKIPSAHCYYRKAALALSIFHGTISFCSAKLRKLISLSPKKKMIARLRYYNYTEPSTLIPCSPHLQIN